MKINKEAKVGLMITISFTLFIVLIAAFARININRSGYSLRIHYTFLDDLSKGAPVKIAGGIKIGQVTSITQSGEKTVVTVWIDNEYKLIKSTRFAIFTSGIIGEKYINVFVPPSRNVDEFLKDGDIVYGIDPPSFDQMMLTFQGFMQDQDGGEVLAEIFQNSNEFVANLNNITEENRYDIRKSVLATKGMIIMMDQQVQTLMNQLNSLTSNMASLSEENKEEFTIAMKNLSELSQNLNQITYRLENGRGTLGKLLTDEEIYYNLKDASISAKDLFRSLKDDPSKLFFRQKNQ